MAFDEWEKNEDGKVMVYPLMAYETFVPHGKMCGLKIHYLESPGELLAGKGSSVPLIMTPEMARLLAAALIKSADEAEHGPQRETAH
jgi:hypothetical protein